MDLHSAQADFLAVARAWPQLTASQAAILRWVGEMATGVARVSSMVRRNVLPLVLIDPCEQRVIGQFVRRSTLEME